MKKRVLALVIACICMSAVGGNFKSQHRDIPPDLTPIELRGLLDLNQGPNDIEAYKDQFAVYVYFHRSFGSVNISLFNETGGWVYSTVVNTNVQQTVVIPMTTFPDGVYLVEVSNNNCHIEGDFLHGS